MFQVAYTEVAVTEGDVAEIAAPTFTDAESGAAVDAPAGTTFALKSKIAGVYVDEATGAITVGEPATAAAPSTGVYEVAVIYPDGSKKTAVATVKVVPTEQAKLYQPEYTEVTVTEGDVAEVAAPKFTDEESGEERDMPEGTTFALNAGDIEGVWIDEETGEIKSSATYAAPATNTYEVAVTYPDGSKDVVVATVKVVPTEQAKLYQPEYTEVTVTEGDVAEIAAPTFTDAESGAAVDAPAGTTFALKSKIAGVYVDEATGAITVGEPATAAAPSTGVYEVAVIYPDGSKKTAVATVKVVPTEQAKLYQPEYTEVTVTEGDVAEVAAPKFTDEESGEERDMPEGTTFALNAGDIEGVWIDEETGEIKSSATYAAPATNTYEVAVTYPDGSKDVVVATVKVVPTEQAKLYQPEYAPATVELGKVGTIEAPKFTDEESGEERDMPEGTTFALKDAPIDGVTINEETGEITVESTYAAVKNVYEVLVTYPDGSSEVVVATIDVIDSPVEEEPGEEQPGEEQPGEEQPGEEQPGEEQPGEEQPGEEQPGEEQPGEEQPGEEQPGEEQPGEEQPGEEQPGEEQPGEEQPGEEQPGEGDLARTGAEVGGLMALMASLMAGAASLFTIRRRKSEQ
nr:Rib/alpha-like domain-containing protein [Pseudoglutamicibacter cumminsii]